MKRIDNKQLWDDFVEKSPQGTIPSTTRWCGLYGIPYHIWGYFKEDSLLGGIIGFEKDGFDSGYSIPLIASQGILVMPMPDAKYTSVMSMHNEVARELIAWLVNTVSGIKISNHYTFPDIRQFLWNGFKPVVQYTYVVDLTDMDKLWMDLEKQTRYEIINHSGELSEGNIEDFNELYTKTFERKGMERPVSEEMIENLCNTFNAQIYTLNNSSTVMIKDNKRAYYLLAASDGSGDSSLCLWETFKCLSEQGIKEVDLGGCNVEKIGLFKRGFAGILRPYFGVYKDK